MISLVKTAVNDDDEYNVAKIESEGDDKITLSIAKGGKTASLEFDNAAWVEFIVGTFDVELLLRRAGLSRLLAPRSDDD